MVSFKYDTACNHFMFYTFPSSSLIDVWFTFVYVLVHSRLYFKLRHKLVSLKKNFFYLLLQGGLQLTSIILSTKIDPCVAQISLTCDPN